MLRKNALAYFKISFFLSYSHRKRKELLETKFIVQQKMNGFLISGSFLSSSNIAGGDKVVGKNALVSII